jgi:hypothetical protein
LFLIEPKCVFRFVPNPSMASHRNVSVRRAVIVDDERSTIVRE